MANNPRSDGAKEMLSEYKEEKSDMKEEKKDKKKEEKPKSEEMGEIQMRVILPESPEFTDIKTGDEINLKGIYVAKSGGKVSVDVIGIVPNDMVNNSKMPSLADVNSALAQSSGGGVPADAGIAPIA